MHLDLGHAPGTNIADLGHIKTLTWYALEWTSHNVLGPGTYTRDKSPT